MKYWSMLFFVLSVSTGLLKREEAGSGLRSPARELRDLDDGKVLGSSSTVEFDRNTKHKERADEGFVKELKDIQKELKKERHVLKTLKRKRQRKEMQKIKQQANKMQKRHKGKRTKHRQLNSKLKHKGQKNKRNKEARKGSSDKQKRKLLLKKFYNLDSRKHIRKLEAIYKSYGISIKKLSAKDLKYIIQNSKQLLKKYHNSEYSQPSARGLQGMNEAQMSPGAEPQQVSPTQNQMNPLNMQQQQNPYQNYQAMQNQGGMPQDQGAMMQNQNAMMQGQGGMMQNQPTVMQGQGGMMQNQPSEMQNQMAGGPSARKMNGTAPFPFSVFIPKDEKGVQEKFRSQEVSGGSMAVKFPDSPPTTYATQQPYYSYL